MFMAAAVVAIKKPAGIRSGVLRPLVE